MQALCRRVHERNTPKHDLHRHTAMAGHRAGCHPRHLPHPTWHRCSSASMEKWAWGNAASGFARCRKSEDSTSKRMRTVLWETTRGSTSPASTDSSPAMYCTAGCRQRRPAIGAWAGEQVGKATRFGGEVVDDGLVKGQANRHQGDAVGSNAWPVFPLLAAPTHQDTKTPGKPNEPTNHTPTSSHRLWACGEVDVAKEVQLVPKHDGIEAPPPAGQGNQADRCQASQHCAGPTAACSARTDAMLIVPGCQLPPGPRPSLLHPPARPPARPPTHPPTRPPAHQPAHPPTHPPTA